MLGKSAAQRRRAEESGFWPEQARFFSGIMNVLGVWQSSRCAHPTNSRGPGSNGNQSIASGATCMLAVAGALLAHQF